MNPNEIFDLAVIGAGSAGQMAVLRAALNHLKTVVFCGDPKTAKRSRATWVSEMDTMPGMFHKKHPITSATREVFQFIEQNNDLKSFLTVIKQAAISVKKETGVFEIIAGGQPFKSRFAILCTGTMDVQPEIAGSIDTIFPYANRGDVFYCMRCDGHRAIGHSTAVIGHKGGAGHVAVTLHERYQLPHLYVLTHGKTLEVSDETKKLLERYGIPVITDEITGILGTPKEGLKGFIAGAKTIEVTRAFIAMGSLVYNDLAKQLGAKLSERDHVLTDEYGETSVPGFYAAGDLVEGRKKQVYSAWDSAVDAVDSIDEEIRTLKRNGTY